MTKSLRSILALSVMALLSACSSLSRDGPTNRAVERGASGVDEAASYQMVDLTYEVSERIKATPPAFLGTLAAAASQGATDLIGPGDTLAVSIFEPSGALFGGGSAGTSVRSGTASLPAVVVDNNGAVTIPFGGRVTVAGMTATEAGAAIRRSLVGKVGNPQVVVSVAENAYNAVTVLGEVRQPGRAPLSANADRILDVIAATGGSPRPVEDVIVSIQRDGQTFTAPLSVVSTSFAENVRLARGDQVNLLYRPRRYSTFGAVSAVADVQMEAGELTLANMISRVGGLDTNSANARSVMVFRFERPEVAEALGLTQPPTPRGVPVVYRLNLEEGAGFFTAGNFVIESGDILYVPRSGTAELRKFFEAVQSITRVVYDVSVTSALNVD